LNIKSIGMTNDQEPLTHNQAYLRYLHFAYAVSTGSRFYNEELHEHGIPSYESIIAACLLEAYELVGAGDDVMDTRCYGFEL